MLMMGELDKAAYKPLGKYLKQLRSRANESLAEASGAVEIDVRELAGYELGKTRPSEDVLLLLISHFGAKDDEAVKLWEMAGYGMEKIPATQMDNADVHILPSINQESRILFTDVVDIMVNNYGVVMNFMQTGTSNTTHPVARVGMSREHAKSILRILEHTLSQTDRSQTGKIASPDKNNQNKN
jgi:transcriptional regulator with XRE-family HTH domain